MSNELYPTFEIPQDITEEKKDSYRNYTSPLFDIEKGDFVTDVSGKIKMANPQEMFIQWCLKAVYTQRFSKIAYTDNYASQTDEALRQPTRKAKESDLRRTITDAIMADPYRRAVSVSNFIFKWETDGVEVEFDVLAVDDLSATMTVKI